MKPQHDKTETNRPPKRVLWLKDRRQEEREIRQEMRAAVR